MVCNEALSCQILSDILDEIQSYVVISSFLFLTIYWYQSAISSSVLISSKSVPEVWVSSEGDVGICEVVVAITG